MTRRIIKVDALSRVEGEGSLHVVIRGDRVEKAQFSIFEPPRFFEALLRGRGYSEAPDITSRICGICPIAYILSASQAMEDALGVTVSGPVHDLRRLIYCGEWIESHVLHTYMLHAPDFLGLEDALQIAATHPAVVERALRLKRIGNRIMEVVGGRAVHPVNTRVGGFYKAPPRAAMQALTEDLKWGIEASLATLQLFAGFDYPDTHFDYHCVSLHHPDEYAIHTGRIISNRGLDIPVSEFLQHFDEQQVPYSNALHGVCRAGGTYLVGPIARYNNNHAQLSALAREAARDAGLGPVCDNPFQSLLVRAVEILYVFEEALRLLQGYQPPEPAYIDITPGAGIGHGCTEAPRGLCYHRYELDAEGRILRARIIPPTAQNQQQMEADLYNVVCANLHLSDEQLRRRCEQTLRNYDPCISCATHFLKLSVDRR